MVDEGIEDATLASRDAPKSRLLRDLLVTDDVSDSDVEMLEKGMSEVQSIQEQEQDDPEMCVECGDQVGSLLTERVDE